jgi:hypothetical protein
MSSRGVEVGMSGRLVLQADEFRLSVSPVFVEPVRQHEPGLTGLGRPVNDGTEEGIFFHGRPRLRSGG